MTGIVAQNVGRTSGLIKAASGGGVWTKIKEITASSDSDISFVDGSDDVTLDSTYPIYVFKFINLHPSNDDVKIGFQGSTDTGSSYGVTLTSTVFLAYHDESDSGTALTQSTTRDEAQSSSFQDIIDDLGNDNDQSASGELWLFSPSSTTYVKHWVSTIQIYNSGNNSVIFKTGGYFNTTSAIDAIQFKCTEGSGGAGNIDAGKIKLYGLGDS
jgi:hypothetical protein